MGMLPEVFAVDAFRISRPAALQQRRTKPVPRRKRQRLRFVDLELVVQRHGTLQRSDGSRQVAAGSSDFSLEDSSEHSEQSTGGMTCAEVRGCRRDFGKLVERGEVNDGGIA